MMMFANAAYILKRRHWLVVFLWRAFFPSSSQVSFIQPPQNKK
jgi:hypothetical protein